MIDKSSSTPLYLQLRDLIQDRIKKGIYELDGTIPSESALQKQFNISRITVRRAIMELEKEGYLDKRPGRGTFVTAKNPQKKIAQELNSITTWTDTMKEQGYHPGTSKIEVSQVVPPQEVAFALNLEVNNKVTKIKRWRTGDGQPFSIMTNYVLSHLVPNLKEDGLNTESLYSTYENKYNIKFGKAKEIVEAKEANEEENKFFDIDLNTPVLAITRITFDPNGKPFEVVKQSTRADSYKYVVNLSGRP